MYISGGITGLELSEIREIQSSLKAKGERVNIIVGSNSIADKDFIFKRVFG
jgi:hypothetical protein